MPLPATLPPLPLAVATWSPPMPPHVVADMPHAWLTSLVPAVEPSRSAGRSASQCISFWAAPSRPPRPAPRTPHALWLPPPLPKPLRPSSFPLPWSVASPPPIPLAPPCTASSRTPPVSALERFWASLVCVSLPWSSPTSASPSPLYEASTRTPPPPRTRLPPWLHFYSSKSSPVCVAPCPPLGSVWALLGPQLLPPPFPGAPLPIPRTPQESGSHPWPQPTVAPTP